MSHDKGFSYGCRNNVYFILTRILRDQGKGPTMLISPLLALMRNQIINAQKPGLVARSSNSSNKDDWDSVVKEIKMNRVDLLLVSPERLSNEMFLTEVLPDMRFIEIFHDFDINEDSRKLKDIQAGKGGRMNWIKLLF